MSTEDDSLPKKVKKAMRNLGVTQMRLAKACGLDQGHLSKVLREKIKLATKTEAALYAWLEKVGNADIHGDDDLRDIVDRLGRVPSERRMHIMELLRVVERLAH